MGKIPDASRPAAKIAKAQRRAFQPGNYSHPRGPREARNKTSITLEALLDTEATAITCKVIEKALEGDMAALRLCLDRLLPVRREGPVAFALPKIETAADALKASSALVAACAEGTLSPREATEIMALIETHIRTLELSEIEARLTELELTALAKARRP
jgi:hypothetical protein